MRISRAASAAEAGGASPRRVEQIAARQRELEAERERAEMLARAVDRDMERLVEGQAEVSGVRRILSFERRSPSPA